MNLKTYIRKEQEFLIFMYSSAEGWEKYESVKHGAPESLRRGFVVAYLNGEIIENCTESYDLPPGTHYIEEFDRKPDLMPICQNDPRISIRHESSKYHSRGKYCTRIRNMGKTPFRVKRFSAFQKTALFGKYRLSTISNDWFSNDLFVNWFNQKTDWIASGAEVIDQDNFGSGNGFWVFEVEFETGEIITVKSKLPNL